MVKIGNFSSSQNDKSVNAPERSKILTITNKIPIIFSTFPKCFLIGEKKINDLAKKTPNNKKGQPKPTA